MAKQFLDATGLGILWNKIKSTFLSLSGGAMTGNIEYKAPNGTLLCRIGSNYATPNDKATGQLICTHSPTRNQVFITGNNVDVRAAQGDDTAPSRIIYSSDNIYIRFELADNRRNYKFNIQKLIDDGYLIADE